MKLHFDRSPLNIWTGHATSMPVRAFALVATLIILASLAVGVHRSTQRWSALEEARAHADAVADRMELIRTSAKKPPAALSKEQIVELNTLVRQLNTPWSAIFSTLERRTPKRIALVAIEPDATRQSVRVQAEARTLDELMAYVEALRADELVEDLVLLGHETNEQDTSRPVRLNFDIRLRSASIAPAVNGS